MRDQEGYELPEAPICMGGTMASVEERKAREYADVLKRVLDGQDEGRPCPDGHIWCFTGRQRQRIRTTLAKWILRGQGKDGQFAQYGTFGRQPGSEAITTGEFVTEQLRRRIRRQEDVQKLLSHPLPDPEDVG